jgi:hypothetical protein
MGEGIGLSRLEGEGGGDDGEEEGEDLDRVPGDQAGAVDVAAALAAMLGEGGGHGEGEEEGGGEPEELAGFEVHGLKVVV